MLEQNTLTICMRKDDTLALSNCCRIFQNFADASRPEYYEPMNEPLSMHVLLF